MVGQPVGKDVKVALYADCVLVSFVVDCCKLVGESGLVEIERKTVRDSWFIRARNGVDEDSTRWAAGPKRRIWKKELSMRKPGAQGLSLYSKLGRTQNLDGFLNKIPEAEN